MVEKGKLYIYRGLPGSGKSTAARKNADVDFVFEADDYFMLPMIGYQYDRDMIRQAHEWCQWRTKTALDMGYNVAVANTFTTYKEIAPYLSMTDNVFIICCTGNFKNIHNVPDDVINRMAQRFQIIKGEKYL